ncbi:MAG: hypothetical protein ACLPYS_06235 [Vulcanimicrobiaceae bacterium]|jgi:hypothetical protein
MDALHLLAVTLPPLAVLVVTAVLGGLVALKVLWREPGSRSS